MLPTYIFDIDETLLHSSKTQSKSPNSIASTPIRLNNNETYHVQLRPGALSLFTELFKLQDMNMLSVGIWTAAEQAYALKVLKVLLGDKVKNLKFIYTRKDCTTFLIKNTPRYFKPLSKFFGNVSNRRRVMLIDDNQDNISLNQELGFSVMKMPPFYGSSRDHHLDKIQNALLSLEVLKRANRGRSPRSTTGRSPRSPVSVTAPLR